MRTLLLLTGAALLGAAPSQADVTLVARGTVSTNSISSGALANANPGDPVTMAWSVLTPGSVIQPGQTANYTSDATSFVIDAGGIAVGGTQGFTMLMANDNPVADGVYIFFTSFGPYSFEFEVGNGSGTFFDGIDITQEAGVLDLSMISSFNWAIHGGGSMFVDFIDLEIFAPGGNGTPFCFGDGTGAACPCGNTGGAGEGCANSSGSGATVVDTGSFSVSDDDLGFEASGLLPNQPALLFSGDDAIAGGNGIAFGDGLRCAGTNVKRLGTVTPDGNGDASWGPGLAATGGWGSGDTRRFQVWYRNPTGGPCGTGFNLSQGVEVTFAP